MSTWRSILNQTNNNTLSRERTLKDKKRDREEDEEDVYERRRLERRLRDKEAAYQEVTNLHRFLSLRFKTMKVTSLKVLSMCLCVNNYFSSSY